MADHTSVEGWKTADDANDPDSIRFKSVPEDTMVYEITGPIFFGAADKIADIFSDENKKVIILRMRSVPIVDATGIHTLETIVHTCRKNSTVLIMSHVNEQPMKTLKKAGIAEAVGEENFCANIDEALLRARTLTENACIAQ